MSSPTVLTEVAHQVWQALKEGRRDVADVVESTGLDQSQVMLVATEGVEAGFLALETVPRVEVDPAADALERIEQGLPERRALSILSDAGGSMAVPDFIKAAKDAGFAGNEVFRWGGTRGWTNRVKAKPPVIELTEAGRQAIETEAEDERSIRLASEGLRFLDEQAEQGVDVEAVQQLLGKRNDLVKLRSRTQRFLSLTEQGLATIDEVQVKREQNALTTEDFKSGEWREISLRPYDITLPAQVVYPAKVHPLRKIMEQTRRAFLELGFLEVVSPMVEGAFWNFDALFQPQDHPARDMQDTFYMADPKEAVLPDDETVEAVRRTHENGGDTGSKGWGYRWSSEEAKRLVLRTHTTAATIRALSENPEPPFKCFCVGWTYRNETIDYKHLPVFHQVDGIIIDENANLATLLGTLTAFYQKMGFQKVRFKPAFYPYTEPSVDVMVYMENRGKWLEMGGSGIFRPEVTEPLGCKHPVLAWGLGVERLAMIRYGFSDIRQLYHGRLDTLEEVPLCR